MIRSTDRFLTTHTGSLPRPDDLIRMMYAKEEGVPVDPAALGERVRTAVAEIVRKQAEVMSYADVFLMLTVVFLVLAVFAVLMKRPQALGGAAGGH